jgi:hypothetical protein
VGVPVRVRCARPAACWSVVSHIRREVPSIPLTSQHAHRWAGVVLPEDRGFDQGLEGTGVRVLWHVLLIGMGEGRTPRVELLAKEHPDGVIR